MTFKELLEIGKKNGCKQVGGCNQYLMYNPEIIKGDPKVEGAAIRREYARYQRDYGINLESSVDDVLNIIAQEESKARADAKSNTKHKGRRIVVQRIYDEHLKAGRLEELFSDSEFHGVSISNMGLLRAVENVEFWDCIFTSSPVELVFDNCLFMHCDCAKNVRFHNCFLNKCIKVSCNDNITGHSSGGYVCGKVSLAERDKVLADIRKEIKLAEQWGDFTPPELSIIKRGEDAGLSKEQIMLFAQKKFNFQQMSVICEALIEGVCVDTLLEHLDMHFIDMEMEVRRLKKEGQSEQGVVETRLTSFF